jgi:hypothetical protein
MNILKIKKKSGGSRIIYAVNPDERREFRALLDTIRPCPEQMPSAHGFMAGRGIVTAARCHVGAAVTLSWDLAEFFPSVRPDMVRGRVPAAVLERCFPDGAPQQGLPTSPAIANIAAAPMDAAIKKALKKSGLETAYTRYADDLSVSLWGTPAPDAIKKISAAVADCIRRCGFAPNPRKTRVQWAAHGRREILGVMVDDAIHVSRDFRRRLRAAKHNAAAAPGDRVRAQRAAGMTEFAHLKPPCTAEQRARRAKAQELYDDARRIATHYGLLSPQRITRSIPDAELGGGVLITTDPAYIYGMSAYTTGWTSCMSVVHSQHDYKRGVAFWQRLRGVSLAYIPSERTATVAGVTRPAMVARALVFALRDGRRAYGHIYSGHGHSWDVDHPLALALRAAGYLPAHECRGALVDGYVAQPCTLPYFDHGEPERVTLQESKKKAYRVILR